MVASDEDRFWQYVLMVEDCWEWIGGTNREGYGRFHVDGCLTQAHRFSYELTRGQVPPELVIDHLCRNPRCVKPEHMEIVTTRENIMRGSGLAARNARKTHCIHGHLLSGDNLQPHKKWRRCRTCQIVAQRLHRLRRSIDKEDANR